MPDYGRIYQTEAERYHRLVSREDYEGNLLNTIAQIRPLTEQTVVEFGAGTGRLTTMLAPQIKQLFAFDNSQHMLQTALTNLQASGLRNWHLAVSDNRHIPLQSHVADITIAGWSFGHSIGWYPKFWKRVVGSMILEMKRLLKSGGTIIIIETLGTGREDPQPPSLYLENYYHWLETEWQMSTTWVRTDYLFHSVAEAEELTRFFFGENMADEVVDKEMTLLPECTGFWWMTV
ncbi:MAG: class I SAM-dependent methyltransferase [Chloroflexota bacterium]